MMQVIQPSCVNENYTPLTKGHATAYCLKGITASGMEVQDGICAMSDKALIGKYVTIYERLPSGAVGEEIGTYLIADTGCAKNVVDVWCEDLDACKKFMKRVYENDCRGKIYLKVWEDD